MRRVLLALLAIAVLFSWTTAYAQTGTGEIWGRVASATGAVVASASVSAVDIDTGATRETHTDRSGRFGFAALPAGRYQVTATHEGFAGRRQDDIVLLPGQRLQVDLPLRLAPMPETIALNPYPPIAESARTHASAFVAETEIQDLPVLGRQYMRLTALTPAVGQDGGGVSVMDLPASQNRLLIDGLDHTSSLTGEPIGGEGIARTRYQLSQDSIEGFRIETSAAPAEVGGAAAAAFSVVTRSGSNALHGSAYEFFGDRSLNAERTIDEKNGRAKPPYRNNQFGATAGGPISKQHNFFFLGYDALRRTSTLREDRHQHDLLARSDHDYWGQHLMLRYMDQEYRGRPDDTAFRSHVRTRSGAASLASAFTGSIVNEARLQYATSREEANLPWDFFFANPSHTRRVEFGETLSWIAGGHSLKAGGDLLRDADRIQVYLETPARTSAVEDRRYSAFVQDAWRASDAVTVDVGVRYDGQDQDMARFGTAVPPAQGNWAPRVGVAFSPGERKHVFRGAYGLFYGSTPAAIPALVGRYTNLFVSNDFQAPRVHQASVGWEVEKYRAGSVGIDYLFARGEHLPRVVNVNPTDPALRRAHRIDAIQSSGGSLYNAITVHTRARVLQQLFYTIAYTLARAEETPRWPIAVLLARDEPTGLASQGSTLQTRYPGDNGHHLTASAIYDTSLLAVGKHGWSKRLLRDWEYACVYTWRTGSRYNAWVSGDINGDFDPFNDLMPGTTWSQYRLPYQASLDPRVTRRFRIGDRGQFSLIWEAFNLTNRPNYAAVENRALSWTPTLVVNPRFGEPTRQLNGRVMQLAARITF